MNSKKQSKPSKGRYLGFWANADEERTMNEYLSAMGARTKISGAIRDAWTKFHANWKLEKFNNQQ